MVGEDCDDPASLGLVGKAREPQQQYAGVATAGDEDELAEVVVVGNQATPSARRRVRERRCRRSRATAR